MSEEQTKRRPVMAILQVMNDYIQEQMAAGNYDLLIPDFAQQPKPDVDYVTAMNILTIAKYCQTVFPLVEIVERQRHAKKRRIIKVRPRGDSKTEG